MSRERDRTTVRRACKAGGVTALLVVGMLLVLTLLGSGPGGAVVVSAAIAVGSLVAAAWLLLAGLLDVFAGEPPGRRRLVWTVGAVLVAMLGPFLLIGAAAQQAGAVAA